MTSMFAKVLGSILRSLFISVTMFIIALSVITREFPPDFGKIQASWENLQQISHLQIQEPGKAAEHETLSVADEEADVEKLQELQSKRAKLGEGILSGQTPSTESSEDKQLKLRVQELEKQLYRLQQRVSELESSATQPNKK